MKLFVKAVVLAGWVSLAGSSWAGDEHSMAMPARQDSKEFQQIKQLAGKWTGTSKDNKGPDSPVTVEYRVTAAGSAVEERLMMGTPHEMVDMYDDEGGKLAMTHYCALGNHPHMTVKETGANKISLEMGPTMGIDAGKDAHMHSLVLEFPDSNHLTQRWTSYMNGKAGENVVITLTRAK